MTEPLAAPRISVIIPAYKAARYLAETLDAVAAQTFTDWECVVVDDGSPDDGAAIAQSYADKDPRFRVLRKQNDGVSAARNTGYEAANPDAEFVVFQDSDDVWEPEALATLATALDAHPEAAGAHALAERIGPGGESLIATDHHAQYMLERYTVRGRRLVDVPKDAPTTLDCLVTKFKMYPPGVVLVRRPLIARAGLWPSKRILPGSEDWDIFAQVSLFGPFVVADRVIAQYRKLDDGQTARYEKGHQKRRQIILRRLVGSANATGAQARLVRRAARAWGGHLCTRQARSLLTSLRTRQGRMAASDLRYVVFFLLATVASDLDLRLHEFLGFFRRRGSPRKQA